MAKKTSKYVRILREDYDYASESLTQKRFNMKKFWVKRYWEVSDEVEVEASTKEEAITKAHDMDLTSNPRYVPDSLNSDPDDDVTEAKR